MFGGASKAATDIPEHVTEYAPSAPPKRSPEPSQKVTQSPEIVYTGLLRAADDGGVEVEVALSDVPTEYVIESFAIHGMDWARSESRFQAIKDPLLSLQLPKYVHNLDSALGRLHVGVASGQWKVHVTRDGAPVTLFGEDGQQLESGVIMRAEHATLMFATSAGTYVAQLEDLGSPSAHIEEVTARVEEPGQFKTISRNVAFLEPGDFISTESDPSIIGLRLLPGLSKPFKALVSATANFTHLCCEQTASKMLAAAAMYALGGDDPQQRSKAESIIIAGVRREETMWLQGREFLCSSRA